MCWQENIYITVVIHTVASKVAKLKEALSHWEFEPLGVKQKLGETGGKISGHCYSPVARGQLTKILYT